ncbi:hypothetical protein LCGC14_2150980 [marine sediment metagenome]|uniref:Uncharacterized protein n=1 Tax=marine sediment metagenome TaxID=412755 RepID=A0A0F9DVH1_9ZZZZ
MRLNWGDLLLPALMLWATFAVAMAEQAAQEPAAISVDNGLSIHNREKSSIQIKWDVPPEDCESNVYRWNGDGFECLRIDRIRILMSQRNLNMRALATCRQELTFMRAEKVLIAIHEDARRKCQKLSKVFDEEAVQCAGAVPRGDESQ